MKNIKEKVSIVKLHLEIDKTSWDELLNKLSDKSEDYINDIDELIDEYIDNGVRFFDLKYLS